MFKILLALYLDRETYGEQSFKAIYYPNADKIRSKSFSSLT
jgi:hypothetical protein